MSQRTIAFGIGFNQSFTGGPRNLCNLLQGLDRDRFNPLVITNRQSALTAELDRMQVRTVILEPPDIIDQEDHRALQGGLGLKLKAGREIMHHNSRVAEILRDHNAEVFWTRNVKGVLLGGWAARRAGLPVIWDIGMEKTSRGMIWMLHNLGIALASRIVTEGAFVAPSIFTKGQQRRMARKLRVINTSVPKDRLEAVHRAEPGSPPPWDPFVILNVATVNPRKNQLMLLRALQPLIQRFPQLRLRIAGSVTDEAYARELERYVEQHNMQDHVEFLGWCDDVAALLHEAHVFTLASRVEGVPQSLLEAMHARTPVVVTQAGGMPGVIDNGTNGFIVPIDDVQAMSQAFEMCLTDQNELTNIAARAQEHVQREFSVERYAARYEALFDELLSKDDRS